MLFFNGRQYDFTFQKAILSQCFVSPCSSRRCCLQNIGSPLCQKIRNQVIDINSIVYRTVHRKTVRSNHSYFRLCGLSDCLFPCENNIHYKAVRLNPKDRLVSQRCTCNGFFIEEAFSMGTDTDLRVQFVRLNLHRSLHTAEAISKHIHIPIARENTCFCFFICLRNFTLVDLLDTLFNFRFHTIPPYCGLLTRMVTIGLAIAASIAITAMTIIQRLKILLLFKSSLLS